MTSLSLLQNKKILVLGIGVEGIDNFLFFRENVPYKTLGVADIIPFEKLPEERKKVIKEADNFHFGKDYFSAIPQYDIIVKSPGIPLSLIKPKEGRIITSQSDIFLENCQGTVIGVTGTKGKSTTCSLIYETLKLSGLPAHLVGNMGNPALSYLGKEKENDIFVYELSSFQLATVNKSPHIAVFLNLYIDHLDKHENFQDYLSCKEKITLYQTSNDFLIYNKDDEKVREIAEKSKAQKIPFSPRRRKENIATPLDPVFKVADMFNIGEGTVLRAAENFRNLPHRLQFVGKRKGIYFYNDSAATIPEATIYAIEHIANMQTLILGGTDKGGDYGKLFQKIKENDKIENIILFTGSGEEIERGLRETKKKIFHAGNMREAVEHAFRHTDKRKACLLSPAFASFNMFKNYKERGEQFIKYANKEKKT